MLKESRRLFSGKSNILTEIIHNKGYKTKDFVEKFLGLKYSTYCYRVRTNSFKGDDIKNILDATGLSYEQIFLSPRPLTLPACLPEHKSLSPTVIPEPEKEPSAPFAVMDIDFSSTLLDVSRTPE